MTDASRIEKAVFNNRKGVELDPTGITTLGSWEYIYSIANA